MTVGAVDWSDPLDALKTWVAARTGLKVNWRDGSIPMALPNEPFVQLHVTNVRDYGRPVLDYEFVVGQVGTEMVPRQHNLTRVTVEVSARAFTAASGINAQNALSQLVARLNLSETQDDLTDAGIAIIDNTPITTQVWEHENRTWSQYTMDLVCTVRTFFIDSDLGSSYIATVPFDEDSVDTTP